MGTQAQAIRGNREAEAQRQIAATNFGAPEVEQVAPGIPVSNDAALAASLKEMRDNSQEYAKLRTEEARGQWESIAADNLRRTQAASTAASEAANIETMNRAVRERQDAERAFSELEAVARTYDVTKGDTEWNIPLDKLKDIATAQQKFINATGVDPMAPGQLQKVTPENAGSIVQNADGTWNVKLQTGEVFNGTAEEVIRRQAAAHVNTKRWAQQQRQIAEQAAQVQQPKAPAENLGQELTWSLADDLAARQRESVAHSFGFSSADEMIQDYQTNKQVAQEAQQFIAEAKQDRAISSFWATHPDFPGTDQANDALGQIFDERGWEVNAENLELAHSLAIQRHLYEPLSQEAIAQSYGAAPARRAAAPPMLRTNNPEITNAAPDPYNMPLADLRKQAIAQELTRGGPNYR
jgi:hypothetical protein